MDHVYSEMDDLRTAKLWLPEHGSIGHSLPVHWLWQIQGLVVDQALLRSVRKSWDHYPWPWNGRITEHCFNSIVAAVHTTMCISEQHREPTTRVITKVEQHIGNTHSSEVNARNPFFCQSGGQVCYGCWLLLFLLFVCCCHCLLGGDH